MSDNAAAIAEIGYLMWCFNQGYGLAEDRAILTGGNWLLEDDSLLHEDDVRDKYQLLDLAADLYAAVAPVIEGNLRDRMEALLTTASRERDSAPKADMRDDPYIYGQYMWFGGRVTGVVESLAVLDDKQDGTCTYCGGVGCKACDARVALLGGDPDE